MKLLPIILTIGFNVANAAPIDLRPDKDMPGAGTIFIDCQFDGFTEPCLFDSGSNYSYFARSKSSLAYSAIGQRTFQGITGKSVLFDLLQINKFTAADQNISNFIVARPPDKNDKESVIGLNAFYGKTLNLNMSSKSLSATDDPIPRHLAISKLKFSPAGLFLMAATIGKAKFETVFDTGAALTTVDEKLIKEQSTQFLYQGKYGVFDANGKAITMKVYLIKELIVGSTVFKNVKAFSSGFSAIEKGMGQSTRLILGYNAIVQSNWLLSGRTQEWAAY